MARIVILTGGGLSAESGLRSFRASDGLREKLRIEDVASPEGFTADARRAGVPRLELNLERSQGTAMFDTARHGPATKGGPAWVEQMRAKSR